MRTKTRDASAEIKDAERMLEREARRFGEEVEHAVDWTREDLVDGFGEYAAFARDALRAAAEKGDPATEDLYTEIFCGTELDITSIREVSSSSRRSSRF
jgi:DNA-binding ferritin-like protein